MLGFLRSLLRTVLDTFAGLLRSLFRGVSGVFHVLFGRIVALVKSILEQNSITIEIAPDTKLVDAGLTSMDMVNLMLGVEAEFDFMIPQDEITPENFQSVETLERLVAGQLAQAA